MKYKIVIILIIILFFICVYNIPYKLTENSIIPKCVWQTYKSKDLPAPALALRNGWVSMNPTYDVILYDDNDIENYIKQYWDDFFKGTGRVRYIDFFEII